MTPGNALTGNAELAALLARLAYREGEFVLSSGRTSSFYLDAKQVTYHPEGVGPVGRAVLAIAREFGAEAVGGPTMGADAIVAATVWASKDTDAPLTGFVVRKEGKRHGLQKWIEGVSPEGRRVALVEDVVTTGGSVLRAVEAVRDAGAEVAVVVALVDREEGGREALEEAGIPFRAVATLSEVRAAR